MQQFTPEMLERMLDSLILDVDSYKASQWLQYPALLSYLESYIEARGGKFTYAVVCGLQMYIKRYLSKRITLQDIDDAELFWQAHGEPFNREGWEYILHKYNGYLPVKILAVREGSVVPVSNAIVKVKSKDEKCVWLESYLETAILRAVWYPTTVATIARSIKQVIKGFMEKTCDNLDKLDFMLHDFGARGVSSKESAGIGGVGHQISFKGSDNVTGTLYSMYYYNSKTMTAFSIPASEHSTITSWLRPGERAAYQNMLRQFGGKFPLFAVVSDSYDLFAAAEIWASLKEDIIKCGSMVVIRPDSGDPAAVVTKLILLLDAKFGHTMNSKGFRVLNHVRIIQGDGIDEQSITDILTSIMGYGFSAENLAFGMGGALLQKLDRDTMKWAMKASAGIVDGEEIEIFKDPITDTGKRSKRGRQMLYQHIDTKEYQTALENQPLPDEWQPVLEEIFDTGVLLIEDEFETVRARAA
jgi:nicotinamide phosphoribosyltransferase